jgi:NAD kinase
MTTIAPRAVVVHRPTEYEELILQHGTREQVAFFLRSRERQLDEVEERHAVQRAALRRVAAAVPHDWRRGSVTRSDLDRYLFGPEDVVLVVGQDGLVANVAKYLQGQPVIGVDPEPGRNPGVLVRYGVSAVGELLRRLPSVSVELRTMVRITTDDGQVLRGLNEIFVGHRSHQSARYTIRTPDGTEERHSSSGVLVGTGTGSTGWCRSVWAERRSSLRLPEPTEERLVWFVREAWPSPVTGTELTEGVLGAGESLSIASTTDRLVAFADGIETDAVELRWGRSCSIGLAEVRLSLVVEEA